MKLIGKNRRKNKNLYLSLLALALGIVFSFAGFTNESGCLLTWAATSFSVAGVKAPVRGSGKTDLYKEAKELEDFAPTSASQPSGGDEEDSGNPEAAQPRRPRQTSAYSESRWDAEASEAMESSGTAEPYGTRGSSGAEEIQEPREAPETQPAGPASGQKEGPGASRPAPGRQPARTPKAGKQGDTFALVTDYWGWGVEIFKKPDFLSEKVDTAYPGDYYRILQTDPDGWARISYGGGDAYLYMGGDVQEVSFAELAQRDSLRSEIVNYALQFVGNAYVWGGTDPNTGADCSGFVQYVYKHAAGIQLDRTTREQVYNGKMIHALEMRPGDLMFYGDTLQTIHHVTMYIGNGQVVHASDSKSGIKISPWNYRDDWLCIVNVLGDD